MVSNFLFRIIRVIVLSTFFLSCAIADIPTVCDGCFPDIPPGTPECPSACQIVFAPDYFKAESVLNRDFFSCIIADVPTACDGCFPDTPPGTPGCPGACQIVFAPDYFKTKSILNADLEKGNTPMDEVLTLDATKTLLTSRFTKRANEIELDISKWDNALFS